MRESEISVLNASSQYSQSAALKAFPKPDGVYSVQCEECGDQTYHLPKFARGEPRNIALIGHWDGWQPFGLPGQHSCGECVEKASIISSTICMQNKILLFFGKQIEYVLSSFQSL